MLIIVQVLVLALCFSPITSQDERNRSLQNIMSGDTTEDQFGKNGITKDWTTLEPLQLKEGDNMTCNTSSLDTQNKSLCSGNSVDDTTTTGKDSELKQGPISQELSKEIRYILQYFIAVFCVLALVTNALNIAVFLSQTHSTTNCYLIAISIIDMLSGATILVAALCFLIIRKAAFTNLFFLSYNILCLEMYLNPVLQRSLYFLIFHVSIERLLVVAFPLKAKEFIFMRYPKSIIVTSCFIVALFHIFSPLKFVTKYVMVEPGNSTIHYISRTALYRDNTDEFAATSTASKVIFVYILLVAALIINLVVVYFLKRHSQKRRQMKMSLDMKKAANQERKTTITIVTSSLVFLILALPLNTGSIVLSIRQDLFGPGKPYAVLYGVLNEIGKALVIISLSTDFLAYMTLSTSFRSTCLRILHIRKAGRDNRHTDLTDRTQVSEMDTKY